MKWTNSTGSGTDVVYVLGHGSGWADNELRFSLRSLEAYMQDLGTVYVVGHRPKWLVNVVHLPFPDVHICKERNIMLKLAYACGHPNLSKKFLHLHDDHFALAPFVGSEIPNWCGGSLDVTAAAVRKKAPGNHWADAVLNTHKALAARGHSTHNFDLHFPMIFDKDAYPEIMDRYDWKNEPRGFVVKSLYANTMGLTGPYSPDLKINTRLNLVDAVAWLKGKPWFSMGNGGLSLKFRQLFPAVYPKPSRCELIP